MKKSEYTVSNFRKHISQALDIVDQGVSVEITRFGKSYVVLPMPTSVEEQPLLKICRDHSQPLPCMVKGCKNK